MIPAAVSVAPTSYVVAVAFQIQNLVMGSMHRSSAYLGFILSMDPNPDSDQGLIYGHIGHFFLSSKIDCKVTLLEWEK